MASWSEPACFLKPSRKSFILNEETADKIRAINKPLVVVCISGPLRQGKSTLLNKFVKFLFKDEPTADKPGFIVNSTRNSTTKGFWAWYIDHPDDDKKGFLIIDIEGLGDVRNPAYDNCLICLAILLSSVFVCNVSSETIDRALIDRLQYVKIAEHIQKQLHEIDDKFHDDLFPLLVVVLRNVSLDSDGESDEYFLDNRLKSLSVASDDGCSSSEEDEDEKEASEVKSSEKAKMLTDYFTRRKLFRLPVPVKTNEKVNQTHTLSDSHLNDEFVEEVNRFCNYILHQAPVKMFHQKGITGRVLVNLLKKYLNHLDEKGYVSQFVGDVRGIIQQENTSALEKALTEYRNRMRCELKNPVSKEKFDSIQTAAYKEALHYFVTNAYLDGRVEILQNLNKFFDENYNLFLQENEELSLKICRQKLNDRSLMINKKLDKDSYCCEGGYECLRIDIEITKECYENDPDKGVMADVVWNEFMKQMEVHQRHILKIDSLLSQSDKISRDSSLKFQSEQRHAILQRQSEQYTTSSNKVFAENSSTFTTTIEQAYRRRFKEASEADIKTLSELETELKIFREQGQDEMAKFTQEEIDKIQKKLTMHSKVSATEVLKILKDCLHLVKPILEFVVDVYKR